MDFGIRLAEHRAKNACIQVSFPRSSAFPLNFLVGSSGFEPPTLRLSGARSNHLSYEPISARSVFSGGDEGIRTLDPLLAGQVLSQLSYTPVSLRPVPATALKIEQQPTR